MAGGPLGVELADAELADAELADADLAVADLAVGVGFAWSDSRNDLGTSGLAIWAAKEPSRVRKMGSHSLFQRAVEKRLENRP